MFNVYICYYTFVLQEYWLECGHVVSWSYYQTYSPLRANLRYLPRYMNY